jgi:ribosomal protein S18 acetylase RimI-like enzyme
MTDLRIVDVGDAAMFWRLPPCANPRFDHRTCDYWENAERGSKASRPAWLETARPPSAKRPVAADNPFAPAPQAFDNPFAPTRAELPDSFADDDLFATPLENPFAPATRRERPLAGGVAPKLALLDRGRGVFGSYAKLLLADDEAAGYCQFGPLSAYPRAVRLRELYAQLPDAPLPAVITCIATTAVARRHGYARRLVDAVCADLAGRGFAAVETYPDLTLAEDDSSAAQPEFWLLLGFGLAVDDERFPVMRREL